MKYLFYLLLAQISASSDDVGSNFTYKLFCEEKNPPSLTSSDALKLEDIANSDNRTVDGFFDAGMHNHIPLEQQHENISEGVIVERPSSVHMLAESIASVMQEEIAKAASKSSSSKCSEGKKPCSVAGSENGKAPNIGTWESAIPEVKMNDITSCHISNYAITPRMEIPDNSPLDDVYTLIQELKENAFVPVINNTDLLLREFTMAKELFFVRIMQFAGSYVKDKQTIGNEGYKAVCNVSYQDYEERYRHSITKEKLDSERNLIHHYAELERVNILHQALLGWCSITDKEIVKYEAHARSRHNLRRESVFSKLCNLSESLKQVSNAIYNLQQSEPINYEVILSEERSEWLTMLFAQEADQASIINAEEKAAMWMIVSDYPDAYRFVTNHEELEGRDVLADLMAKELPIALAKSNSSMFSMLSEFKQFIAKQQQKYQSKKAAQDKIIQNLKMQSNTQQQKYNSDKVAQNKAIKDLQIQNETQKQAIISLKSELKPLKNFKNSKNSLQQVEKLKAECERERNALQSEQENEIANVTKQFYAKEIEVAELICKVHNIKIVGDEVSSAAQKFIDNPVENHDEFIKLIYDNYDKLFSTEDICEHSNSEKLNKASSLLNISKKDCDTIKLYLEYALAELHLKRLPQNKHTPNKETNKKI